MPGREDRGSCLVSVGEYEALLHKAGILDQMDTVTNEVALMAIAVLTRRHAGLRRRIAEIHQQLADLEEQDADECEREFKRSPSPPQPPSPGTDR